MKYILLLTLPFVLAACEPRTSQQGSKWHLMLSHDAQGKIISGSKEKLVSVIRAGCQVQVAWGARRQPDPSRTIEHSARPVWVAVRDNTDIEVQLDDYLINLKVLGEPAAEHPRRKRFGGTEKAVKWRAALKTDGTFDAVWYYPHSGEFIERIPQRFPMKWFSDCEAVNAAPLYADVKAAKTEAR